MKKKFVGVRMPDDILVRVKKIAGDQGRSVSETVGILVGKSLESGSNSGLGIDPEIIRKEVDSAIRSGLEPILKPLTLLLSKGMDPDPVKTVSAPEIRPELGRWLAESSARSEALLLAVASRIIGKNAKDLFGEITTELDKSPGAGTVTIRYLAEKVALIEALLREVSTKMSGANVGEHGERMRISKTWAAGDMKKLFGG